MTKLKAINADLDRINELMREIRLETNETELKVIDGQGFTFVDRAHYRITIAN